MLCNISQRVPQDPVLSIKSGHLFERSLIEAYIAEHGRCPITGEPLQPSDIVAVRPGSASTAPVARASTGLAGAAVPTLLDRLHAEWDAAMLEQFTQRQQLAQMQQELSHALQRGEAACRVIASLTQELESLRANGVAKKGAAANGENEEEEGIAVPPVVEEILAAAEAAERKRRKQRKSAAATAVMRQVTTPAHSVSISSNPSGSSSAGALCVAVGGSSAAKRTAFSSAVTGDHSIALCDMAGGTVRAYGAGHTQPVHTITVCDEGALVASASQDHTVRVWKSTMGEAKEAASLSCAHTLRYAGGVAAMSRRVAQDNLLLCGGTDAAVYLSDLERGEHVVVTAPRTAGAARVSCIEFHPYTSLSAVALEGGELVLFDVKQMRPDTIVTLPDAAAHGKSPVGTSSSSIASLSFSADCVSLVTGLRGGGAYVWDLRKVDQPLVMLAAPPQTAAAPAVVRYAPNGATLAMSGEQVVQLYESSKWEEPVAQVTADGVVTDVCWSAEGESIAVSTMNGVVQLYTCSS